MGEADYAAGWRLRIVVRVVGIGASASAATGAAAVLTGAHDSDRDTGRLDRRRRVRARSALDAPDASVLRVDHVHRAVVVLADDEVVVYDQRRGFDRRDVFDRRRGLRQPVHVIGCLYIAGVNYGPPVGWREARPFAGTSIPDAQRPAGACP